MSGFHDGSRKTPRHHPNWGGVRPGGGRPAKLDDPVRTSFYLEARDKTRLANLADAANNAIDLKNEAATPDRQAERTSASELARVALNDYVSAQQGKEEAIAKRMRPYLGLAKPRLENDSDTKTTDGRYLFDERDRQTTYLDRPDREGLMLLTDLANAYVEQGNRRVDFKKDRDATIAFSELAREAVEIFLDTYEDDPRKLAEHLRSESEKETS